ncbi:hypothetical protein M0805_006057 [Coniferiporia weirii]|nr:hypothetical protein M0805_006057 [Coniferiporia weirii]
MSVKSLGAVVLHAAAVAVMTWGYFGLDTTVMNTYIVRQKGGHLQFLTIQALFVALLTMVLSLCSDIIPVSQLLKRAKRAVFTVALPLSVVVTVIYWSLLLLMPSLILQAPPAASEPSSDAPAFVRIPFSLDLALHAVPAVSMLIDFFAFEQSYDAHVVARGAPAKVIAFGVWYSIWVEYCASFNGTFPYPFLTVNTLPIRVVIYAAVTSIAIVSFRGINNAHLRAVGRRPGFPKKSA